MNKWKEKLVFMIFHHMNDSFFRFDREQVSLHIYYANHLDTKRMSNGVQSTKSYGW